MAYNSPCEIVSDNVILVAQLLNPAETTGGKKLTLSYDVASGSEIMPCIKIDKPLVVYRFSGIVMTFITTLRK